MDTRGRRRAAAFAGGHDAEAPGDDAAHRFTSVWMCGERIVLHALLDLVGSQRFLRL